VSTDQFYMERCLQLAQLGAGNVSTNPMVGCVIVHNGTIIGEGYHQQYGHAHAEVNAINAVKDKSLLTESTLYVNLEPCAHYGKTPPCADLITQHQLKRVVIGTIDTFSKVAGKGIEKLKTAGIDVTVGICNEQCRYLNRRFFYYHEHKRPYIILKWAQTSNGFMGLLPANNHLDKKISNAQTNVLVHRWRTEEDAILVGKNTAILDNPALTARLWEGKNPIRIVIDPNLEVPQNYNVFDSEAPTLVFNALKQKENEGVKFEQLDFRTDILPQLLDRLYALQIQSVLVEGGSNTLQHFIDARLWNEARIITSTLMWETGIPAPKLFGAIAHQTTVSSDIIITLHPAP
jgi:diaminohydroxyphosphoribosylaminopyrimidine deaminase / 5-amino-6-(5-phosphoribosylamino)uracil reductase